MSYQIILNLFYIYKQSQQYALKKTMQDNYLSKYLKNTSKFLPAIQTNNHKNKHTSYTIHKLKQPTQQSLMLDIKDIDESLHHKNFMYRNGNLFSSDLSEKLVTQLHACLKKQALIMEDGFSLWNGEVNQQQDPHHQSKRLTNKVETLNQKLAKLSMQNVYDYDLKKYMQIMKVNRNRWSLFKRVNDNNVTSIHKKIPTQTSQHKSSEISQNITNNLKGLQTIPQSISNNTSTIKANIHSKSRESDATTLSPVSKLSKLLESHKDSRVSPNKKPYNRKVLTQISQFSNPEDETPQVSKYDIKNMLKKQKNIIFIWLPPATYPQFHGMFTYSVTRKLTICRLKKYFFFRRSLNQRFFNSILQQISSREDKYIQGIEIVTNKDEFSKVYQPLNWKMKSIEGTDKIRIRYSRPQL